MGRGVTRVESDFPETFAREASARKSPACKAFLQRAKRARLKVDEANDLTACIRPKSGQLHGLIRILSISMQSAPGVKARRVCHLFSLSFPNSRKCLGDAGLHFELVSQVPALVLSSEGKRIGCGAGPRPFIRLRYAR